MGFLKRRRHFRIFSDFFSEFGTFVEVYRVRGIFLISNKSHLAEES